MQKMFYEAIKVSPWPANFKNRLLKNLARNINREIENLLDDIQNNLLPSSNWGKRQVDVAAPGENIYSTLPGGRYGYMTGTSQATAFVSGMAALLLAKDPTLKPAEIKALIMGSVDKIPQLTGKLATGGRVNAYHALLALSDKTRPSRVRGTELLTRRPVSLMNQFAEAPRFAE